MIEAAGEALSHVFDVGHLAWMMLGVAMGMLTGLLPGVSGVVGMTLLLPVIVGMDPFSGVAVLVGLVAVNNTSDTFPAVLIGVPGSAGSQASILDGYPMSRQGKAATALGASFFASMLGGVIGAAMLLVSIFTIRPIVLAMGTPELFMLTLLGLSMVGVLSRGSPLTGLLAALAGLAIGSIGIAPGTAVYRFTFDTIYLIDGLPIIAVAMGLFGIPTLIDLLVENQQIAADGPRLQGSRLEGVRQVLRHKRLVIQSAVVGNLVGVVPGLGGSVVQWLAYGLAERTSRNTENFGKGDIRGLIAPEAANNADQTGAMVPTLMFGIPGSPSTAVLLGGLMLMGVFAGPDMVTTQLPLTLSVVWTLAVANIVATGICFALTGQIARLTNVRSKLLVPFLVVLIMAAAHQATRDFGDVLVVLVLGIVGWAMLRVGWPITPMLVGFVLSDAAERYLFRAVARYELDWLTTPNVLAIGAVILVILGLGLRRRAMPVATE